MSNNVVQVKIPAKVAGNYPIFMGHDLIDELINYLSPFSKTRRIVIVSDSQVSSLYGHNLSSCLQAAGFDVNLVMFPEGELSKNITTKTIVENQLFQLNYDRSTICLAFGGGVVGDLVGFVAATYMRGIDFIQIPTSMLAMVDSSVGGKVAINNEYGKNNVGVFWQPKTVFMDFRFLQSLSPQHIMNGFFEAIKIFLTCDSKYFQFCVANTAKFLALEHDTVSKIIARSITLKAHVVELDETEKNLRMILNFGHTVAHAIEKNSNYQILHGFAVAIGLLVEAKIANLLGELSDQNYFAIEQFLLQLNLDFSCLNVPPEVLIKLMYSDKKNTNQAISMVLLNGIGTVKSVDEKVAFTVSEEVIKQAIIYFRTKAEY